MLVLYLKYLGPLLALSVLARTQVRPRDDATRGVCHGDVCESSGGRTPAGSLPETHLEKIAGGQMAALVLEVRKLPWFRGLREGEGAEAGPGLEGTPRRATTENNDFGGRGPRARPVTGSRHLPRLDGPRKDRWCLPHRGLTGGTPFPFGEPRPRTAG